LLGRRRQAQVVNSVDDTGRWMSEIATELPAAVLSRGLERRFCDWQVEVSQAGRQRLLAFNPSVSFGRQATPSPARATCCPSLTAAVAGCSAGRCGAAWSRGPRPTGRGGFAAPPRSDR
jgi:hypothetical protein